MKNVTNTFVSLGHLPYARSFIFYIEIFATNPINLSVVLGVLIFFRKRSVTILNSAELRGRAIDQLEKARAHLRKVEIKTYEF
ncbi:hypothetical protein AMTRI_Chr05g61770 [Amborella trichopoda]